ncbi:NUDIX domain-containing protein [Curtobacterium caseinilyticum]|uniref:NUDIX domain-containing protein n=1 Tax=Curtobacterium caseinilyticum TaxID=3055137 RepID=A0ABT7TMR8_9MICO|nr:NUDIX domain-containing protein [Curtobacterium caseinilyticum]MDM7890174.1 NUDIX domain-containing protein [Curtobacterium caseinilyticum]
MVTSAGLLLHRGAPPADDLQVYIAHMGGPFWRRRPRAWSIPKGLLEDGEDALGAARREFAEEIGVPAPQGEVVDLGEVRQSSGKRVRVFALHAEEFVVDAVRSNTVRLELPRGSGQSVEVPEVDDARWVPVDEARGLLVAGQVAALDRLVRVVAVP